MRPSSTIAPRLTRGAVLGAKHAAARYLGGLGFIARICRKIGATLVSSNSGTALASSTLASGSPKRSMISPASTMRSTHPLKVLWNRGTRNGSVFSRSS